MLTSVARPRATRGKKSEKERERERERRDFVWRRENETAARTGEGETSEGGEVVGSGCEMTGRARVAFDEIES
jgi:hypothetical protein